mmetsp:Transcript_6483/g.13547  ORF Transcript_6483/g.13547 Transcript_6483/m.13547 type:complete len:234 (-) Transcript_6483:6-707(-)
MASPPRGPRGSRGRNDGVPRRQDEKDTGKFGKQPTQGGKAPHEIAGVRRQEGEAGGDIERQSGGQGRGDEHEGGGKRGSGKQSWADEGGGLQPTGGGKVHTEAGGGVVRVLHRQQQIPHPGRPGGHGPQSPTLGRRRVVRFRSLGRHGVPVETRLQTEGGSDPQHGGREEVEIAQVFRGGRGEFAAGAEAEGQRQKDEAGGTEVKGGGGGGRKRPPEKDPLSEGGLSGEGRGF